MPIAPPKRKSQRLLPSCDVGRDVFASLPRTQAYGSLSRFWAIPATGTPRWLLPVGLWKLDSVLASWSPYRLSSRLQWQAVRGARLLGALASLPRVSEVDLGNSDEVDWAALGWSTNLPPLPVIYVGTPGPCRKAVIHLVDQATGLCRAVVKAPLTSAARQAILDEAEILAKLAGEQRACAPRLLHFDRDRAVVTQEFVPGASGDRRFRTEYWDFLQCLVLREETTTLELGANKLHTQLRETTEAEFSPDVIGTALSEMRDARPLPACWVHGDFAPWNIKQLANRSPVLVDWEDAQRGGLPLQDAYHFFHMQDYLFGKSPSMHNQDVRLFSEALGVDAKQCSKLEIAYLLHSYQKCALQNDCPKCQFLLQSLKLVLRENQRSVAYLAKVASPFRGGIRSSSDDAVRIRKQLFAALMTQLHSSDIPYCILGGSQNDGAPHPSDVDLMFRVDDMALVGDLLAQTARASGAMVVQAIPHEATACYFVLARQDGQHIGYLDPDCYRDYRRSGRTWLCADPVIASRRKYRESYVPSAPDEFTYYLIKKVLKQSIALHQLKRLQHLYAQQPVECQRRIARFWSQSSALSLQRAIVEQNLSWFQMRMPAFLSQLKRSAMVEQPVVRWRHRLWDAIRLLRRVYYPTGMFVLLIDDSGQAGCEIANGLLQSLAPAFRRTCNMALAGSPIAAFIQACKRRVARVRSTLVVSTADRECLEMRHGYRLRSILTRFVLRPDVVVVLKSEPAHAGSAGDPIFSGRHVIRVDGSASQEEAISKASGAILRWLAARIEARYNAQTRPGRSHSDTVFNATAQAAELHSGSD